MSYPALDDAEAILRHTTALLSSAAPDGALALLSDAVRRFPADAALAARHADALLLARQPAEAEAEYRRSIAIGPASFEIWYGFGNSLLARYAYGEARDALTQAVALDPGSAGARCNLAEALFQMGEVDAAIGHYLQAAAAGDARVQAHAMRNIACIIPGSPGSDNAAVLAVRRALASSWRDGGEEAPRAPTRAAVPGQRKLRIGYMSAFFGSANWMKPVYGVINHHDRTRFEVHMIADRGTPSAAAGYRDHDDDRIWRVVAAKVVFDRLRLRLRFGAARTSLRRLLGRRETHIDRLDDVGIEFFQRHDAALTRPGKDFARDFQPFAAPAPHSQTRRKRENGGQVVQFRERRAFGLRGDDLDLQPLGRNLRHGKRARKRRGAVMRFLGHPGLSFFARTTSLWARYFPGASLAVRATS
jgi:tetratricopeptide (TPR) repeat protein